MHKRSAEETNITRLQYPDSAERSAGLENFQEVLRLFPPFRDDDGATFGAIDINCPDCDAVFSSSYGLPFCALRENHILTKCSTELNHHYLTRFCPGAAVAVYVMTRDRWVSPQMYEGTLC